MRGILGLTALVLLAASPVQASNFSKFYHPAKHGEVVPYTGEPEIRPAGAGALPDMIAMYTQGYDLVGYSNFTGPRDSQHDVVALAKKQGAEVILYFLKYESTKSGAIPYTLPHNTVTTQSGTVTTMGPNGQVSGDYRGASITPGTIDESIPWSEDWFEQSAYFYAKAIPHGVGAMIDHLPADLADSLGSARGTYIVAVRSGGPAFLADIMPKDVVQAVDGVDINVHYEFGDIVSRSAGKTLELKILRKGNVLIKHVTVPAQ